MIKNFTKHSLDLLAMKNERKKYLVVQILEPFYGEDDIAKAEFFKLLDLDSYEELKAELKKQK